jgi:acyl-CoA reductase-like NAD-dependent aldehyde dehydrogenase
MDAAERMVPITLELGGKDPAVVLPDTNLNQWIHVWLRGIL